MSRNKKRSATETLTKTERFLLALAASEAAAERGKDGRTRLAGHRRVLTGEEVDDLVRRDLACWRDSDRFVPTDAGRAWARRQKNSVDPFRAQHGDVRQSGPSAPSVDLAESPLLWLHRRRDAQGNPHITDALFAAGERLRADFTFGNMTPRVTLNWTAAAQGSRNPQGLDPSESALAARQRVRRALDRVGPELSGVLLDVCCFLKKLEEVERDRQWPARSAKIILTLALRRLARHYGYSDCAEGPALRKSG